MEQGEPSCEVWMAPLCRLSLARLYRNRKKRRRGCSRLSLAETKKKDVRLAVVLRELARSTLDQTVTLQYWNGQVRWIEKGEKLSRRLWRGMGKAKNEKQKERG